MGMRRDLSPAELFDREYPAARKAPHLAPVPSYARPLDVRRAMEVDLSVIRDQRGDLVVAELGKHLPFIARRMYSLVRVPEGEARGGHAHKELEQLLFVLHGALDLVLDDGVTQQRVRLDDPEKAIYLRPMVWRELEHFAPGTVCVVLASEVYDESDYLRSYDAYRDELAALGW